MATTIPLPSKRRINQAGERVRGIILGEIDPVSCNLPAEVDVIRAFRAAHAEPLKKTAANLRYYVQRYSSIYGVYGGAIVAQRLKRMRTIFDKLTREPGMELARMEDVGGCRALFASVDEIEALVDDLSNQKRWTIARRRNYIESPRPDSGYRAFHLVVQKDDRRIEIQLRTLTQHSWAELVETTDRRTGAGLKEGRASADLTEYYRLGSEMLAASESDAPLNPDTQRRFQELHRLVSPDIA